MTRILLHPVFLELLSSNALIDRLSRRKISNPESTTLVKADANPVWLSEDDLCNMWKVVHRSKLDKTPNGLRMENLAWRLWFYARSHNGTDPLPVSRNKMDRSSIGESTSSDWSPKYITTKQFVQSRAISIKNDKGFMNGAVKASVINNYAQKATRQNPSKSFVARHDFSLLRLDSSTDSSDSGEFLETEKNIDKFTGNERRNSNDRRRRRPSKKKKDVDKYLQLQIVPEVSGKSIEICRNIPKSNDLSIIKPSPEMKRTGATPRLVTKGFAIPKKPGSSLTSESTKFGFSSISSDDAFSALSHEPLIVRQHPNANNVSSFSRSSSPQVARRPVSMLTILMNGQLTMSEDKSKKFLTPPPRPSAPKPMYRHVTDADPIIEETEPSFSRSPRQLE